MSGIPPINPSGWNNNIKPTNTVGDGSGGSGGYAVIRNQEQIDEAEFQSVDKNPDEFEALENKSLLTIIKEFLLSLWTTIREFLGLKNNQTK